MPVKTYPLVLTDAEHRELVKLVRKHNMTLKQFIMTAIERYTEELEKGK